MEIKLNLIFYIKTIVFTLTSRKTITEKHTIKFERNDQWRWSIYFFEQFYLPPPPLIFFKIRYQRFGLDVKGKVNFLFCITTNERLKSKKLK